jgi:hypothetical protein
MPLAVQRAARRANKPLADQKQRKADRSRLDTRRRTGADWQELILDFKAVIGWCCLLPLALFSFITFAELLMQANRGNALLSTTEFVWFALGGVMWMVIFAFARQTFMIAYVFGHEWSHIIAAKLCGAVVYDWHVGHDGGWVDTNKSNTFISLAPYLVPAYTVLVLIAYGIAGLFGNLEAIHEIHLGRVTLPFDSLKTLCFLIGFTWWFHLSYTLRTLRIEQSDLKRNGTFFSGWLITLCNLYIVAAMLIIASDSITWEDGWNSMHTTFAWTFGHMRSFIAMAGSTVSDWFGEAAESMKQWKMAHSGH